MTGTDTHKKQLVQIFEESLHVNKKNIDGKLKQRIQTFKSKKKKYN